MSKASSEVNKKLIEASANGGIPTLTALLTPANVNITDEHGMTPLMAAVQNNRGAAVELLLRNHADVNTINREQGTALILAARKNHCEMIQRLIDNRADVNSRGAYTSPLHAAAGAGYRDAVELLLANRADVNATGTAVGTALTAAATHGDKTIIELLLHHRADVNAVCSLNGSALRIAVDRNDVGNAKLLIDYQADLFREGNESGISNLYRAVERNNQALVALLLDHGVDINGRCGGAEMTPLAAAIWSRDSAKMVAYLLGRGAGTELDLDDLVDRICLENDCLFPNLVLVADNNRLATLYKEDKEILDYFGILDDHVSWRKKSKDALCRAIIATTNDLHENINTITLLTRFAEVDKKNECSLPNIDPSKTAWDLALQTRNNYIIELCRSAKIRMIIEKLSKIMQKVRKDEQESKKMTESLKKIKDNRDREVSMLTQELTTLSKVALEHLAKWVGDGREVLCLRLARLFKTLHLADPLNRLGSYHLLSQITSKTLKEYREANKDLFDMLSDTALNEEIILVPNANGTLEPTWMQPSLNSPELCEIRLSEMVRHLLFSEYPDPALGHFIAEYALGYERSVQGLPEVTGVNIASMLALINIIKERQPSQKAEKDSKDSMEAQNRNAAGSCVPSTTTTRSGVVATVSAVVATGVDSEGEPLPATAFSLPDEGDEGIQSLEYSMEDAFPLRRIKFCMDQVGNQNNPILGPLLVEYTGVQSLSEITGVNPTSMWQIVRILKQQSQRLHCQLKAEKENREARALGLFTPLMIAFSRANQTTPSPIQKSIAALLPEIGNLAGLDMTALNAPHSVNTAPRRTSPLSDYVDRFSRTLFFSAHMNAGAFSTSSLAAAAANRTRCSTCSTCSSSSSSSRSA